jgi:hypothetical protein
MKEGFYLSPDGLYIIELEKSNDYDYFKNVIGPCLDSRGNFIASDFLFDISSEDAEFIFSSWELLE